MKTFKTTLLTIALLLCSISTSAYDFKVNGICYNIHSSLNLEVSVTEYGDYSGEVIIPEIVEYNNETYSVTGIEGEAFYFKDGLTSITIPNSVTWIGDRAFQYCSKLASITISNSVTGIGDETFYGCTGLTSVTIPNSVTWIGIRAFYNCNALTSITIPKSVTGIGNYAFLSSGLSSLTFEAKNLNLDYFDVSLESLTIGSEVTTVTGYCNTPPAKTIWLTNTPPEGYEKAAGKINYVANEQYTELSNVEVYPYLSSMFDVNGVKYVPVDMAERTCDAISCNYDSTATDITIASTVSFKGVEMKVRELMPYTFYGNNFVKSVTVSHACNIRESAFCSCYALETANIEIISSSTNNAETFTFADWTSTNSYLSYSTSLETYTFTVTKESTLSFGWWVSSESHCDELIVTLDGYTILRESGIREGTYTQIVNGGMHTLVVEYTKNSSRDYGADKAKVFDISVNGGSKMGGSIDKEAFKDCSSLKALTLGEGVLSLGESAFSGCSSLQEVVIPNSVTEIENGVFNGCFSLVGITIPQSTTTIGNNAFTGCTTLTNLTIENRKDILKLGTKYESGYRYVNGYRQDYEEYSPLFADCPLDSVYIGGKISYNTSSDKGYSPFYRNTSLRSVVIGDKEEAVYDNEFYGCTALKNVSIGNGVTTIGNWAFSGCSSLESFAFGKNVASIGQEAFSDCTNMTQLTSLASVPPTCGTQALDDINKWNCTLKVIEGSKAAYQAAEQWRDFFFLEEVSGIKEILDGTSSAPTKPVDVYTLQGVMVKRQIPVENVEEELPAGIYIVNGKKMIVR